MQRTFRAGAYSTPTLAFALLVGLLLSLLAVVNPIQVSPVAAADDECVPETIYVNAGTRPYKLQEYTTAGDLVSDVALTRAYTDIAITADGARMYGIAVASTGVFVLDEIDLDTGAPLASVDITGIALPYYPNALSVTADGTLLTGGARVASDVNRQTAYEIDPVTGAATSVGEIFPENWGSAGDFLTLADGDLLAVGDGVDATGSVINALFRVSPEGETTMVGTVPQSYGAAQVDGKLYLATVSPATLSEVSEIPSQASSDPIPTTPVTSLPMTPWGATSANDAGGGCIPALSLVKSADTLTYSAAGEIVEYTFTVENTGMLRLNDIAVSEVAFDGAGAFGEITPTSIPVLMPGEIVEFSANYEVHLSDVDRGSIENTAIASARTDAGDRVESEESTVVLTAEQAAGISLVKTASPAVVSTLGEPVEYTFEVTNTGNTTLTEVIITEQEFSGSGQLGPIEPASVDALTPGTSATFTATYSVTEEDLVEEFITNTAVASGQPPSGGESVISQPSTAKVEVESEPSPVNPIDDSSDSAGKAESPSEPNELEVTGESNGALLVGLSLSLLTLGIAGLLAARRRSETIS